MEKMDDYTKDFIRGVEQLLKRIIPEKEVEFIELLLGIYRSIPIIDLENLQYSGIQAGCYLAERFSAIPLDYPQFDKPPYLEYVARVHKISFVNFITDNRIEGDAKIYAINEFEDWIKNLEFIYPEVKGNLVYEEFVNYMMLGKVSLQNKEAQLVKDLGLLFDQALIQNIDVALRQREWIDPESPTLCSVLNISNWNTNTNSILWRREQQTLVYLFYLLNDSKRKIYNGTITHLISKTFLIKGEVKTPLQLSRSLSNYFSEYNDKKKQKPQEILDIEELHGSCRSKL